MGGRGSEVDAARDWPAVEANWQAAKLELPNHTAEANTDPAYL